METEPAEENGAKYLELGDDDEDADADFKDRVTKALFSFSVPTRVEGFHPLEHPSLQFGNGATFRCPLCAERVFRPCKWTALSRHYELFHWRTRRYIGIYTCFLCRMDHPESMTAGHFEAVADSSENISELNAEHKVFLVDTNDSSLQLSYSPDDPAAKCDLNTETNAESVNQRLDQSKAINAVDETRNGGDIDMDDPPQRQNSFDVRESGKLATGKDDFSKAVDVGDVPPTCPRLIKRRATVGTSTCRRGLKAAAAAMEVVPHFHCPLCDACSPEFWIIEKHCRTVHPGSAADPDNTPLFPETLYTPLFNPEPETREALKLPDSDNGSDLEDAKDANSIANASTNSPPARRVRFAPETRQVTYCMELSFYEKLGSMLGPLLADEANAHSRPIRHSMSDEELEQRYRGKKVKPGLNNRPDGQSSHTGPDARKCGPVVEDDDNWLRPRGETQESNRSDPGSTVKSNFRRSRRHADSLPPSARTRSQRKKEQAKSVFTADQIRDLLPFEEGEQEEINPSLRSNSGMAGCSQTAVSECEQSYDEMEEGDTIEMSSDLNTAQSSDSPSHETLLQRVNRRRGQLREGDEGGECIRVGTLSSLVETMRQLAGIEDDTVSAPLIYPFVSTATCGDPSDSNLRTAVSSDSSSSPAEKSADTFSADTNRPETDCASLSDITNDCPQPAAKQSDQSRNVREVRKTRSSRVPAVGNALRVPHHPTETRSDLQGDSAKMARRRRADPVAANQRESDLDSGISSIASKAENMVSVALKELLPKIRMGRSRKIKSSSRLPDVVSLPINDKLCEDPVTVEDRSVSTTEGVQPRVSKKEKKSEKVDRPVGDSDLINASTSNGAHPAIPRAATSKVKKKEWDNAVQPVQQPPTPRGDSSHKAPVAKRFVPCVSERATKTSISPIKPKSEVLPFMSASTFISSNYLVCPSPPAKSKTRVTRMATTPARSPAKGSGSLLTEKGFPSQRSEFTPHQTNCLRPGTSPVVGQPSFSKATSPDASRTQNQKSTLKVHSTRFGATDKGFHRIRCHLDEKAELRNHHENFASPLSSVKHADSLHPLHSRFQQNESNSPRMYKPRRSASSSPAGGYRLQYCQQGDAWSISQPEGPGERSPYGGGAASNISPSWVCQNRVMQEFLPNESAAPTFASVPASFPSVGRL